MAELTKIETIALKLTSSLIRAYGKDLTGTPDVATPLSVKTYFRVVEELKKQLSEQK